MGTGMMERQPEGPGDVDLRFVERAHPEDTHANVHFHRTVHILQWRRAVAAPHQHGPEEGTTIGWPSGRALIWSEWEDVRVEKK
jgi:hypothetical protein